MWINIVLFTFLYELMAMNDKIIGNEKKIIFYNDEEGNTKIEVLLQLFILVIFIKKENWKKI